MKKLVNINTSLMNKKLIFVLNKNKSHVALGETQDIIMMHLNNKYGVQTIMTLISASFHNGYSNRN